ncbi:hypothetical protein M1271_05640 [Patescibacteria group bacterium]|nr:hypothetical protein [Patescibacteria group bacterium]MCL5797731.1 hypothetical protein [Patescibacteria group bacterium]
MPVIEKQKSSNFLRDMTSRPTPAQKWATKLARSQAGWQAEKNRNSGLPIPTQDEMVSAMEPILTQLLEGKDISQELGSWGEQWGLSQLVGRLQYTTQKPVHSEDKISQAAGFMDQFPLIKRISDEIMSKKPTKKGIIFSRQRREWQRERREVTGRLVLLLEAAGDKEMSSKFLRAHPDMAGELDLLTSYGILIGLEKNKSTSGNRPVGKKDLFILEARIVRRLATLEPLESDRLMGILDVPKETVVKIRNAAILIAVMTAAGEGLSTATTASGALFPFLKDIHDPQVLAGLVIAAYIANFSALANNAKFNLKTIRDKDVRIGVNGLGMAATILAKNLYPQNIKRQDRFAMAAMILGVAIPEVSVSILGILAGERGTSATVGRNLVSAVVQASSYAIWKILSQSRWFNDARAVKQDKEE